MLLFNNFFYLIFLIIALAGYFVTPKKYRWITLLCFSLIFYISFSYKFFFFIISTIVTIYLATLYFDKVNNRQKRLLDEYGQNLDGDSKKQLKKHSKRKKKAVFILVILFNIGILFVLKYLNFLGGMMNDILGWFNVHNAIPHFSLILPLGISFYTFQALGYLIDCYWGKVSPQKNFFKFSLFISFFPQIVQGPISRYEQIGEALVEGGDFDYKKITKGFQLIAWGLFKKMVVADLFANFVANVFNSYAQANAIVVIIGIAAYLIQDYADFSGCIDIARGSAECFGINLPQNFERPYFSLSIAEYWRRWHMTLGTWFKDYIFYPISVSKFSLKLGKFSKKIFGNFGKNIPAILGLLVTWLATGLWHGASWNYIVWGLYFGVLIVAQIIFKPLCDKLIKKLKINTKNVFWKIFSWARTIILLMIGRTIFRANSIVDSFNIFIKCFEVFKFDFSNAFRSLTLFGFDEFCIIALVGTVILLAVDLFKEFKPNVSIRDKMMSWRLVFSWSIFLMIILSIVIFGAYGVAYHTSDFIYMQF